MASAAWARAILIIEGEERPLRQWDFVHCPPGTRHAFVAAGTGPSTMSLEESSGSTASDYLCSSHAMISAAGSGVSSSSTISATATEPLAAASAGVFPERAIGCFAVSIRERERLAGTVRWRADR
jgi:hypothetical protein